MNNRFKFRVWDKRKKQYADRYVIGDDGWAYQLHDAGEDSYDLIPDEDVIVEQCTGLKDKNGKLIYEGDVALFDNGTCEIKGATICFTGSGFCAKWDGGHTTPLHAINDIIEIIGNIHEMEVAK